MQPVQSPGPPRIFPSHLPVDTPAPPSETVFWMWFISMNHVVLMISHVENHMVCNGNLMTCNRKSSGSHLRLHYLQAPIKQCATDNRRTCIQNRHTHRHRHHGYRHRDHQQWVILITPKCARALTDALTLRINSDQLRPARSDDLRCFQSSPLR